MFFCRVCSHICMLRTRVICCHSPSFAVIYRQDPSDPPPPPSFTPPRWRAMQERMCSPFFFFFGCVEKKSSNFLIDCKLTTKIIVTALTSGCCECSIQCNPVSQKATDQFRVQCALVHPRVETFRRKVCAFE